MNDAHHDAVVRHLEAEIDQLKSERNKYMNAIDQTKAEVAHFGVVERYINDLRSKSSSLTDDEFTLIAGNLRGFYATILPLGPNEPTTMALLEEAETAIEEYSCRTQVSHIATEMEGLAARIRSFLSNSRGDANV